MITEWHEGQYINYLDGSIVEFTYIAEPSVVMQQRFVDEVAGVIVLDNYYHPILLDMMFNFLLIRDFSNVDVDYVLDLADGEDSVDYWEQQNRIEDFINSNNLSYVLRSAYGSAFIDALYDNIMCAIEYKTGIHTSKLEKEVVSILSLVNKYLNEIDVDKMSEFVRKVNGIDDISADAIVNAYINGQANNPDVAENKKE